MAYQKTQWKDHIEGVQVGTPVNAVNMNKIEEGIAAALPASAISSNIGTNGTWWIKLPGGIMICTGAQTWTNVAITDGETGIYRSQILYFDAFPRPFAAAPHCIIGVQVGESNPYWIAPSDYGTTATKPQGFRLFGIRSMTLSTVTISYIAIGLSS